MSKWGKLVFKVSRLPSLISCFLALASRLSDLVFAVGDFLAPISFYRAPSVPSNCVALRRAHHFLLVLARFLSVSVRSCVGLAFRVRSTVLCCRGLCSLSDLARTRKRALYRSSALAAPEEVPWRPSCAASTCHPKRRRGAALGPPSACFGGVCYSL